MYGVGCVGRVSESAQLPKEGCGLENQLVQLFRQTVSVLAQFFFDSSILKSNSLPNYSASGCGSVIGIVINAFYSDLRE